MSSKNPRIFQIVYIWKMIYGSERERWITQQICGASSLLCRRGADTHRVRLMGAESLVSQELFGTHTLSAFISRFQGQEFTPKVRCMLSVLLQQQNLRASVWSSDCSCYPFAIFWGLDTFSRCDSMHCKGKNGARKYVTKGMTWFSRAISVAPALLLFKWVLHPLVTRHFW